MDYAKKITIWHTNDVHSRFENYIPLATYAKGHVDRNTDLILDAGDFADKLSVMVSGTGGLGAMRLLSAAGTDAMAVGNNEFFAGVDELSAMAGCGVPMLAANLRALDGSGIPGVLPFIRLERAGVRILLAGCCPFFWHVSFFTDNAGVKLLDPVKALREIMKKERASADICILLSHGGIKRDLEIAENVDGIDVIIGGHSHTFMDDAQYAFGKIIHHSGCYAQLLGKLDIFLDDENRIVGYKGQNLKTYGDSDSRKPSDEPGVNTVSGNIIPSVSDPELLSILEQEEAKGEAELSKPLFTIPRELKYDPYSECDAVNAVADSLYKEYGGDFAVINNGIISEGFSGEISRMSLLKAAPSILNPTTVWWKGGMIRRAFAASADMDFIRQDGKGPGFRGKVLGTMAVSRNVRVYFPDEAQVGQAPARPDSLKCQAPVRPDSLKCQTPVVLIDGVPMDDEKVYCVIADDYLYRGISGYTMLGGSEQPEIYHPGYIRDMLEKTLRDEDIIAGSSEKRIFRAGQEQPKTVQSEQPDK